MLSFFQELYEGLTCNEEPGPIPWPEDPNFEYRPIKDVLQANKLRAEVPTPVNWERKIRFGADPIASYVTSNGEDTNQSKENNWDRKLRVSANPEASYGDDTNMILSNDSTSSAVPAGGQPSASASSSSQAHLDHPLHSDFSAPGDRRWRDLSMSQEKGEDMPRHDSLFQPTRRPRDFSMSNGEGDDEGTASAQTTLLSADFFGSNHVAQAMCREAEVSCSDSSLSHVPYGSRGRGVNDASMPMPSSADQERNNCSNGNSRRTLARLSRSPERSYVSRRSTDEDITMLWPNPNPNPNREAHGGCSTRMMDSKGLREDFPSDSDRRVSQDKSGVEKPWESCMMDSPHGRDSESRSPYGFFPGTESSVVKERYIADKSDLLDMHVAHYFKTNPDVWEKTTCEKQQNSKYLINCRNVVVEWFFAETDSDNGYLIVRDGPLIQPFCNYVDGSADNEKYEIREGMERPRISQIPKEGRISFSDKDMVYTRLEAMRVAKEQAKIRDQAADRFKKTGDFVNNDEYVRKYQIWHQTALKQEAPTRNPNPSYRS